MSRNKSRKQRTKNKQKAPQQDKQNGGNQTASAKKTAANEVSLQRLEESVSRRNTLLTVLAERLNRS